VISNKVRSFCLFLQVWDNWSKSLRIIQWSHGFTDGYEVCAFIWPSENKCRELRTIIHLWRAFDESGNHVCLLQNEKTTEHNQIRLIRVWCDFDSTMNTISFRRNKKITDERHLDVIVCHVTSIARWSTGFDMKMRK
jgi:hypothetical protein